jgi:hypothetical protein
MTPEQLYILRRKINTLNNMAYSRGCANESEQQSYRQQDKYAKLAAEAADDIFDYVVQCSSTVM